MEFYKAKHIDGLVQERRNSIVNISIFHQIGITMETSFVIWIWAFSYGVFLGESNDSRDNH